MVKIWVFLSLRAHGVYGVVFIYMQTEILNKSGMCGVFTLPENLAVLVFCVDYEKKTQQNLQIDDFLVVVIIVNGLLGFLRCSTIITIATTLTIKKRR
jgi:hypothetical protein